MKSTTDLIRKLRREKNYSQEHVAHQLGISQKAYSEIENGKTTLKHEHIVQLAKILGVTADTFCQVSNCCVVEQKTTIQKLKELLEKHNISIPNLF